MRIAALLLTAALSGCATTPPPAAVPAPARPPAPALTGIDALLNKPLYTMTPQEVHRYIGHMHKAEPDLRKRIAAIGRQNIGQPYVLHLLGEYPFELHDTLPLFSLASSDCVVFAEHTYAMALSQSWEEFFWMLQRIRYKDGVIGVATRNHYTEVDWNINNNWLVSDISAELAGSAGTTYGLRVDREKFLRTRHKTERSIPVQLSQEHFVPTAGVAAATAQLQDGDLVNIVSTRDGSFWVSHVGLVVTGPGGERRLLHSQEPQVREESFDSFIARAHEREQRNASAGINGQKLAGFKFLRLNDNIVVPPAAPQPRPGIAASN